MNVKRIVMVWAAWLMMGTAAAQMLPAPQWTYSVVAQYPHAVTAFTEGLLIRNGQLIESTGLYGHSGLFVRDLQSGKLTASTQLAPDEFGEGTAVAGSKLYQLTWREGLCHVYDLNLRPLRTLRYSGEGWGLTFDGHELIRSDGSAALHFHDPVDFHETHVVAVRDAGQPIALINELEAVDGKVFANVWTSDRIVVIDPANGAVIGWLDLDALKLLFTPPRGWNPRDDVLNGIAYDTRSGHFWVTGKRWPAIFEISITQLDKP